MNLYCEYVSSLDQHKLTEYVFINLYDSSSLRYSAVKKLFLLLSKKVGFHIRPHMLRHTHATSLINADWDMALVQKRLGHVSVQTTINPYTHIDNKKMKSAFQLYLTNQEKSQ